MGLFLISSMGVYGGFFSPFGAFESPYSDIGGRIGHAGYLIGSGMGTWPWPGNFGYFGALGMRSYIDALTEWRVGRVAALGEAAEKEDILPGVDISNYADRGAGYVDKLLGGDVRGEIPSSIKMVRRLLGDDAAKGEQEVERKRDQLLQAAVKDVIGEWIGDPNACGAFLRRWQNAKDNVDRAMALFDPHGDGRYIEKFQQLVDLPKGEGVELDKYWEVVADKFSEMGDDVINAMGKEVKGLVGSRYEVADETPFNESSEGKYKAKIKEKGYTDEEAVTIVSALGTEEEAEEVLRTLKPMQQNKGLIDQYDENIRNARANLSRARVEGDKNYYRKQIEEAKKARAKALRERADQFLDNLLTSRFFNLRYGMVSEELGYPPLAGDVRDVPTAVAWVYNRMGRNVVVPQGSDAEEEEHVEEARGPRGPAGEREVALPIEPPDGLAQYTYVVERGAQTYYCFELNGAADLGDCIDSGGNPVALPPD